MAEILKPEQYNVNVKRAAAVATFKESTPFQLERVKRTVKKAGFSFEGLEVVARGFLSPVKTEHGDTAWILTDKKSELRIRLLPTEGDTVFQQPSRWIKTEDGSDTLQVRGVLIENKEIRNSNKTVKADFTLKILRVNWARQATIPPLRLEHKKIPDNKPSDGWF